MITISLVINNIIDKNKYISKQINQEIIELPFEDQILIYKNPLGKYQVSNVENIIELKKHETFLLYNTICVLNFCSS